MWWFTVNGGGLKWWACVGETQNEKGSIAAVVFEKEDRRCRALMYELTPSKEKKEDE